MILMDDLADLLQEIEEANIISEKLDMKKTFETVTTTAASRGEIRGPKAVSGPAQYFSSYLRIV